MSDLYDSVTGEQLVVGDYVFVEFCALGGSPDDNIIHESGELTWNYEWECFVVDGKHIDFDHPMTWVTKNKPTLW